VAAAILVTTAGEIQLVPMLLCEYAFHDIQSPFRVDSVVNARESCFANVAIFFFLLYRGLWRGIEFVGVIAEVHIGWETGFAEGGEIESYLFARFLTILTDCSVDSQRVDLGWKGGKRGEGTYGCLVGSGLSKLAHTDALPEWMGWLCCGKP
jgi:hypothetical protein